MPTKQSRKPKFAPDDPSQSKAFIEKAKEIEADEKASAADDVIGRLAKQPPGPRKPRKGAKAMSFTDVPDWSVIPAPQDDGGTRHLPGAKMAPVQLRATDGSMVDLSRLSGRTVVYAYPRTGKPDVANPPGWDLIPGARGCTPQSCSFRDHFAELKRLGVQNLYGLSTQDPAYQKEAAERLHLPFVILSDEKLTLAKAMSLPTFETGGMTLLKRFTLVLDDGVVTHVFYPVFPPDQSADDVVQWLSKPA